VWKKAVLLTLAGSVIGVLIGIVMCLAGGGRIEPAELIPCGLYGAAAMGGSMVYEIEKWSVTRCTVVHFLIVFGGYCAVGALSGWFKIGDAFFWISLAVMIVAYAVIWLICYNSYKRQVREMNDELKQWRRARRPEIPEYETTRQEPENK